MEFAKLKRLTDIQKRRRDILKDIDVAEQKVRECVEELRSLEDEEDTLDLFKDLAVRTFPPTVQAESVAPPVQTEGSTSHNTLRDVGGGVVRDVGGGVVGDVGGGVVGDVGGGGAVGFKNQVTQSNNNSHHQKGGPKGDSTP